MYKYYNSAKRNFAKGAQFLHTFFVQDFFCSFFPVYLWENTALRDFAWFCAHFLDFAAINLMCRMISSRFLTCVEQKKSCRWKMIHQFGALFCFVRIALCIAGSRCVFAFVLSRVPFFRKHDWKFHGCGHDFLRLFFSLPKSPYGCSTNVTRWKLKFSPSKG